MPRRILQGQVVSDKNDMTITVLVERRFTHPMMKKTVRKSKKYRAHDAENTAKVGDMVSIIECAPISKMKRWRLVTPEIDAELKAAKEERSAEASSQE